MFTWLHNGLSLSSIEASHELTGYCGALLGCYVTHSNKVLIVRVSLWLMNIIIMMK